MDVHVGDRIRIASNRVGGAQRCGTILEIVASLFGNNYRTAGTTAV
jgi:hypothetical protein